jgi:hypothetical protein
MTEGEFDEPAGYASLVHSLVGVVTDMHGGTSRVTNNWLLQGVIRLHGSRKT